MSRELFAQKVNGILVVTPGPSTCYSSVSKTLLLTVDIHAQPSVIGRVILRHCGKVGATVRGGGWVGVGWGWGWECAALAALQSVSKLPDVGR